MNCLQVVHSAVCVCVLRTLVVSTCTEAVSADACLREEKPMRLMINTSEEDMVSALERMVLVRLYCGHSVQL